MTHTWDGALGALLCAGVVAIGCLLVPQFIAAVPEPEVDEQAEEPKELYRAIAERPGLRAFAGLVGLLAGGLIWWSLGWSADLVVVLPTVPLWLALAVIDWRTRLLPTRLIAPSYALVLAGIAIATIVTRSTDDLVRAAIGWAGLGGTFVVLWLIHPNGMGFGDVRLSGVLGLALGYLGWGELVLGGYAGFLLGAVIGGGLTALKVLDKRGYPFGPFLLAGAVCGIALGRPFWRLMVGG